MRMGQAQGNCVQCVLHHIGTLKKMPMVQRVNVQRDIIGILVMATIVFARYVHIQGPIGHQKQNATNVQSDIIMLPKVAMTEMVVVRVVQPVKSKIPLPTGMDADV